MPCSPHMQYPQGYNNNQGSDFPTYYMPSNQQYAPDNNTLPPVKENNQNKAQTRVQNNSVCSSCGNPGHSFRQCAVFKLGVVCIKCKKKGHLANVCRGATPQSKK